MNSKYIFLLLVLLIQVIKTASAQNYIQFANNSGYWNEHIEDYVTFGEINIYDYTTFINGDTLISGSILYHKLYQSGEHIKYTNSWNYISTSYFTNVFSGMIREDSLKHVYLKLFGNEKLIYDFNLQINDTLNDTAYWHPLDPGTYVSLIDSVFLGTAYAKRYHLSVGNNNDYVSLIEGIGSTFGLLELVGVPFERFSTLNCFKSDSTFLELNPGDCSFVNVQEPSDKPNVLIYPNPFSDFVQIDCGGFLIDFIEIYDPFGQIVIKQSNYKSLDLIDTYNLSSGVYFLHGMTENKIFAKKIIKY